MCQLMGDHHVESLLADISGRSCPDGAFVVTMGKVVASSALYLRLTDLQVHVLGIAYGICWVPKTPRCSTSLSRLLAVCALMRRASQQIETHHAAPRPTFGAGRVGR